MAQTAELIRTPFGATSTAAEVVQDVDLSGKRAIVTGGGSGIGIETARALAGAGADVTLAVRRVEAAEEVAADIRATSGNQAVHVAPLELVDPASIAAFAAAWSGPLHILVNNAGVMAIQELTRSPGGQEMQFATNHLGHFALAQALHPALASAGGARIVSVSSSGHLRSPVVFDDLDYRFRVYDPFGAYGQAKTANVLFAVEATRRWEDDGIVANALMPGGIFTALQRHVGGSDYIAQARERFADAGVHFKTPEQGAATSVLLAASPLLDGVGGRYFDDCNEAVVLTERTDLTISGVAPYALDPANAERLWQVSLDLTT
ncbi:SDR family NAD(P)-dependent oxidoreductase [Luteipulveratus mongoliensis]|uniref:Probable oxidoreductase n=1 Tax=Luteipulveratus mongoliensis TaxID=571913 RepID=A0A0K1JEP2_9MICO|nr:SDR family NAD(P)-dependent oxidoreductase [Luteipulveratus mongoliensis]AKU15063.1 oxidoreductase [Luteipulveratus mongoliensis]